MGRARLSNWSKKRSAGILALTLVLGLAAWVVWLILLSHPGLLPRPPQGSRDSFSPEETSLFRPGDLVLRRGVGTVSDLIVTFLHDGTNVSHCALILSAGTASNTGVVLLHCVSGSLGGKDGVQEQSLEDFNHNSQPQSLVVLRPVASALQLKGILVAAEVFRHNAAGFDNNFDLADRRTLYCSELMVSIFETAGWWPLPHGAVSSLYRFSGRLLNFQTFLNPQYFQIIISHNPHVPR